MTAPRPTSASILVILLSLASCAGQIDEAPTTRYWPAPPEIPRFMHEFTLREARDIRDPELARQASLVDKIAGQSSEPAPVLQRPARVASAAGSIYVTDIRANLVHVFDIPRHRYYTFGYRFEGKLAKPIGIALDGQRNVYVADQAQGRVVVYDRYGLYLHSIGDDHQFDRLTGVAVAAAGDRIYAVDTGGISSMKHEIVVFDGNGTLLRTIGRRGSGEVEFNMPTDILVAPHGDLVVLDAGNFRIQILDRDGRFIREWGEVGDGLGQLARPRGLAMDPDGLIYVSDSFFSNIQVYTPEGRLLLPMGEHSLDVGAGHYALIAGLAVDETSRLYVLDQFFKKIEVIRKLPLSEGRAIVDSQAR